MDGPQSNIPRIQLACSEERGWREWGGKLGVKQVRTFSSAGLVMAKEATKKKQKLLELLFDGRQKGENPGRDKGSSPRFTPRGKSQKRGKWFACVALKVVKGGENVGGGKVGEYTTFWGSRKEKA